MHEQKKAKKYERQKLILNILETLLSLLLILILIFGGYTVDLRNTVAAWTEQPYLQLLFFSAMLGLIFSLLTLPFSFFGSYWLEHFYKLSNQSLLDWFWEKMKGLIIGLILFIPLLLIFYYFLLNFPGTWWFWTASVLFIFSVLLGRIAPTVIFPLFYKFERLEDENIKQRMDKLAREGNFRLEGVYRFNMSKTTKKANAAFTGLGKSKRIILGDTLLAQFSLDEIEAVFAHEVGHFVHKHLIIGVVVGTLSSYLSLFVAYKIYEYAVDLMNFNGQADLAALPLLSLILSLIGFLISPLSNAQSRWQERQADRYALSKSSNPQSFLTALKKLAKTNLTDESPHPLIEFLFHSHPSIERRLNFAGKQGVNLPPEESLGG